MKHQRKLESWALRELPHQINYMILEDQHQILAFGVYRITADQDLQQVWKREELVDSFLNRRTALSYCVAEHRQDFNLARQIQQLDHARRLIQADINTRQKLADSGTGANFRDRVRTKLQSRNQQLRDISVQLEKCIARAKYLQLRGFTNETARTRRA